MLRRRIDFSCKHNVLIRDADGVCLPMDVPYFTSEYIAPGTWRLHSDGDAMYLVEGDDQAIVIDSGYGAGNLREYCQTLTLKPVRYIINTHDHFDHTANNAYFEKAYMTAATKELATIPFPSFEGIDFPRDYDVEIVKNGDIIDLGGRTLEVIEMPDHAVGSIALLDKKGRILFCGDEITAFFKKINTKVKTVLAQYEYLWSRKDEFDIIWPGPGPSMKPEILMQYIQAMRDALNGEPGEPGMGLVFDRKESPETDCAKADPDRIVYDRFKARPCDMKVNESAEDLLHIRKYGVLLVYTPETLK